MDTLKQLNQDILQTERLLSLVGSMKTLAKVNARIFSEAERATQSYRQTIERGLQVVLRDETISIPETLKGKEEGRSLLISVGSDQGLCGKFNRHVTERTIDYIENHAGSRDHVLLFTLGHRLEGSLQDHGCTPDRRVRLPGDDYMIMPRVEQLLSLIYDVYQTHGLDRVQVMFNTMDDEDRRLQTESRKLLPIDQNWLEEVHQRPWPGRGLPTTRASQDQLLQPLLFQHLSISIFETIARSLSAENESRFRTMQAAEETIEQRLAKLRQSFFEQRQRSITEELLDITSGYEALSREEDEKKGES